MLKTLTNGKMVSRLVLLVILAVIQVVTTPLAAGSPLMEAVHAAISLISLFFLINWVI